MRLTGLCLLSAILSTSIAAEQIAAPGTELNRHGGTIELGFASWSPGASELIVGLQNSTMLNAIVFADTIAAVPLRLRSGEVPSNLTGITLGGSYRFGGSDYEGNLSLQYINATVGGFTAIESTTQTSFLFDPSYNSESTGFTTYDPSTAHRVALRYEHAFYLFQARDDFLKNLAVRPGIQYNFVRFKIGSLSVENQTVSRVTSGTTTTLDPQLKPIPKTIGFSDHQYLLTVGLLYRHELNEKWIIETGFDIGAGQGSGKEKISAFTATSVPASQAGDPPAAVPQASDTSITFTSDLTSIALQAGAVWKFSDTMEFSGTLRTEQIEWKAGTVETKTGIEISAGDLGPFPAATDRVTSLQFGFHYRF